MNQLKETVPKQIEPKQQHSIGEMIEFCEEEIRELMYSIARVPNRKIGRKEDMYLTIIATLRGLNEELEGYDECI